MVSTTSADSNWFHANGADLWHERIGSGRAIVLVHAGIADSRMWDPQVAAFSGDHLVLRYDMRGFGQSSIPPKPYSHHNDLTALIQALDIQDAMVIGASYGGNVAAEFTLEHPESVRALILVNSLVGMAQPSPGLLDGWNAVNAAMDAGAIDHAVELETRMWIDGPQRSPDEVDPELRAKVTAMNAALFARIDEQEAAEEQELDPEALGRLPEIQVPTLIIVGELDQLDAMVSADALVAGIPGARKVTIPDAAHLSSMERPATFNRIVRDFLDSL